MPSPAGYPEDEGGRPGSSPPGLENPAAAPTPDDPRIIDLVVRAQSGERAAFETLIETYQDRVWRRALYRIGDHDEAYDLSQEVFLTCFRKIGQFRGESKFWTWLARIVDNHVKNRQSWLERRGRSKTFSLDRPPGADPEDANSSWDPPDPAAGPRRLAESHEAVEALNRHLDRLSPDHREILLLRFADGLAYEEIAEALQISIGTVKSRINRARAELRTRMEEFLT